MPTTLPPVVGSEAAQSTVSPSSVSHEIATQQEQNELNEEERQSKWEKNRSEEKEAQSEEGGK